jgi:hypothetical protein
MVATTLQPWRRKCSAVSRPKPEEHPVIITVFMSGHPVEIGWLEYRHA